MSIETFGMYCFGCTVLGGAIGLFLVWLVNNE